MIHIAFVTKDSSKADSFRKIAEKNCCGTNSNEYFSLLFGENGQTLVCRNGVREFLRMLDANSAEDFSEWLIILDYCSLYDDFTVEGKEGRLGPVVKLFLMYPEIKIWVVIPTELREATRLEGKLFHDKALQVFKPEFAPLILKDWDEIYAFGVMLCGGSQIFDPMGIRSKLKEYLLSEKINFDKRNFERLSNSRQGCFALSIDEEAAHANFWGYALYSFGYAVLPITTYDGINRLKENKLIFETTPIDLVCRDFDLQFPDKTPEDDRGKWLFELRGVRRVEERYEDYIGKFWESFLENSPKVRTWMVTQAPSISSETEAQPYGVPRSKLRKKIERTSGDKRFSRFGIEVKAASGRVLLRGQSKEIEGFSGLLDCPEIYQRFIESRDFAPVVKTRKDAASHSLPPVNSEIAQALLGRAKTYFEKGRYLFAALLAEESREILNGFSLSLSLKALKLKVLAEAYLELEMVGIGDMSKYMPVKLAEIRRQVHRMCAGNREAERNARMQIFNDLRKVYEEFEQFDAAEIIYEQVLLAEMSRRDVLSMKLSAADRLYKKGKSVKNGVLSNFHRAIKEKSGSNRFYKNSIPDLVKYGTRIMLESGNTWWFALFGILLALNRELLKNCSGRCLQITSYFTVAFSIMFMFWLWRWKKTLYSVLGAGTSVKRFAASFIIFNLLFIGIYKVNSNNSRLSLHNLAIGTLISTMSDQVDEELKGVKISGTSLTASPAVKSPQSDRFPMMWIFLFHMAGSVFFLGIVISLLYRRFTRR